MLGVAYLAAILLPLLLALGSAAVFVMGRLEPRDPHAVGGELASVSELPRAASEPALPSLPVGFRYDAIAPGPLQMVDGEGPSTKVCPDCAETVLHSARVCKHCRFRFDPPLRGSHAV